MNQAAQPLTTIVAVPREGFSLTIESLKSLYANTESPFDLIYVDAGSPNTIQKQLTEFAKKFDFTLIRCDQYLTPNQSRNIGLKFVASPYVAFVDNNVIFKSGWLNSLLRCAQETGAMIVTPLTLISCGGETVIHNAGGSLSIVQEDGERLFRQDHCDLVGKRLSEVGGRLKREPTEHCEFHAVLIRSSVFSNSGKLNENMMSVLDHTDLSLEVRLRGGEIFFEPEAVVTYVVEPVRLRELPYHMLRWSDNWTKHSQDRFLEKWNAKHGKPHYTHSDFAREVRGAEMPNFRRVTLRWFGWRIGSKLIECVERVLTMLGNRRFAGLDRPPRYRLVHRGRLRRSHTL